MYIEGWGVDGFGVFHDYEERGLPEGLCLFLGPNEAGKSTLLAFLRGVLFGFPPRKAALHYPPQHGGRHGGRVFLGGAEGPITVEREVGTKAPRIIYPDSVELGDVAVRRLLGGVDDSLFRSVFAFSLAELADFASLSSAGVSERIFSAGIAGAGPIAGSVSKQLEKDASELVRPRSGGLGNDLLRRLGEADAAARDAARQAAGYPELVEEEATLGSEVERFRRAGDDADRRERRAGLLREAWPVHHAAGSAREQLQILEETLGSSGSGYGADDGLLALAPRATAVARTVELQRDRLGRLPELRVLVDGREVALQRRLADLGAGWNAERARSFDASLPRQQEARTWSRALASVGAGVDDARRAQVAAADALVALDEQIREVEKELATLPAIASDVLDTADAAIRQLRADLQSLGLMDNDLRGRQAALDDRRRQSRATDAALPAPPWGTVGLACLVAAILLLVVGVWLAMTATVAGGLAAAAGAVVLAAAATAARGWAARDAQRRQAAARDAV
ncbi:MAG: AAA family ATPase, partial [Thermoanaerobaculaceae bacterium]|nr:AAA family ATPase [Thermoanaerobaculaceae bacterium]